MAVDTSRVDFDQKGQLEQIVPWILADETLWAVYDCKGAGTGFVAFTNKRLLFYDKVFMMKRKALTTLPYSKITSVSTVDEGRGLWGATSELVVMVGSHSWSFEFRGGDKAQKAYQTIVREMLQSEPS